MPRSILSLLICLVMSPCCSGVQSQPLAEKFLHAGEFAKGETALLLQLDSKPGDDEARFGLGVVQFMRAVENLGQALYEYGAVSEKAGAPFLRLPVPRNDNPSVITYRSLGRVLDAFAADLRRAEATLANVEDPDVKLRLELSKIKFDFTGMGRERTTLIRILNKLNSGRFEFEDANPQFLVHFDRGDVAWLRAYCHLLSAMVEAYRSVDEALGFEQRVKTVFPNVEVPPVELGPVWWEQGLKLVDPPRLRRMRLHLVKVCELNRETWKHIRLETDDDFEWLPAPRQTDQLGLPLDDERIDAWLEMMVQWEGCLKGERLISGFYLQMLGNAPKRGEGLSAKNLLDDPPDDILNIKRIQEQGIDQKYFELLKGKERFDVNSMLQVFQLFDGPFGFAYAARLN